jgi:hypothetical protein
MRCLETSGKRDGLLDYQDVSRRLTALHDPLHDDEDRFDLGTAFDATCVVDNHSRAANIIAYIA